MKINRLVLVFTALALAFSIGGAHAESVDVTIMPGYVDLGMIQIPSDAKNVVDIDLGPDLLRMASAVDNGDEDLSEALSSIYSIRVKQFELDEVEADMIRPIVEDIQRELEIDDWKRIVHVREGDETVSVNIKLDPADPAKIAGLMVLVFEPDDEATFVNIVGSFALSQIGNMIDDLDVDLEGLLDDVN